MDNAEGSPSGGSDALQSTTERVESKRLKLFLSAVNGYNEKYSVLMYVFFFFFVENYTATLILH